MKAWHVLGVCVGLFSTISAMIKLVGPEETEEDLTKPISLEREITWYRFRTYFDDGNTQFRVFDIARKYYFSKDSTISFQNFIQAGKEYVMSDMADSQMSFQAIATLVPLVQRSLIHFLNEKKNSTFTLEEFFKHSVQGQFKQFARANLPFNKQPWEIQQKMKHELEEKKLKNPHPHMHHDIDHDERYIKGDTGHAKDLNEMRKDELRRRYQNDYTGVEWQDDGRRVIDDD